MTKLKSIFIAIETDKLGVDDEEALAQLFSVKTEFVKVMSMEKCRSKNYSFYVLCDLYLWICKYWYGIYYEKLTVVRVGNIDELSVFFKIKYGDLLRFAISSKTMAIFDKEQKIVLKEAEKISVENFDEERINNLKPYIEKLQAAFSIIFINDNPYK